MEGAVRPWRPRVDDGESVPDFADRDCFIAESSSDCDVKLTQSSGLELLTWSDDHMCRQLRLFPYPKLEQFGRYFAGGRCLPRWSKEAGEQISASEDAEMKLVAWTKNVHARVGDLKGALEVPEFLWERLATAWSKSVDQAYPTMNEIVRQADIMPICLGALDKQLRKILRRVHRRLPIDRVQEVDRISLMWLSRQPGRTTAERAGGDQRVLAITRWESMDTLENRVIHAYAVLAYRCCRHWMHEHGGEGNTEEYAKVDKFQGICRRIARKLETLGVGLARTGVAPNHVLMQDRNYRQVWQAWLRLLRQLRVEEDLWAWQAQTWTDFCLIALVLSFHRMPDMKLQFQSPIFYREESRRGRRLHCDTLLAVFWCRRRNAVVELQARPKARLSCAEGMYRAWVWLRITSLSTRHASSLVPVWTPHALGDMKPEDEARDVASYMRGVSPSAGFADVQGGLILAPARGLDNTVRRESNCGGVHAVNLDVHGDGLTEGMSCLQSSLDCMVDRLT